MEFISDISNGLPLYLKQELFKYRYEVFVETLGWELDTPEGVEIDQFDRDDTVYVVAKNESGDIVGCARLLPTTSPYLLGDVFPELLNGVTPPNSKDVWEISRFTSLDLKGGPAMIKGQFSSETSIELLKQSIKSAKLRGAKKIISVSPVGVERLLRKAGFKAHRAGPPKIIDGYPIVACWIEV